MDKKDKDLNSIILTVIGVATLLVAIVGATFAYFTAQADIRSQQSVEVQTVTMPGLIYDAGDDDSVITLNEAIPGDHGESSFTIQNPQYLDDEHTVLNGAIQKYDVLLTVTQNEFSTSTEPHGEEQLFFYINDSIVSTYDKTVNLTNGAATEGQSIVLINQRTINPGETHTYNIKAEFLETNENQNENKGKTLSAHVTLTNINS